MEVGWKIVSICVVREVPFFFFTNGTSCVNIMTLGAIKFTSELFLCTLPYDF